MNGIEREKSRPISIDLGLGLGNLLAVGKSWRSIALGMVCNRVCNVGHDENC